ncbi:MAG: tRNA (adenosine(37)-N6)-threonylcarbamoyltransferase complex dimerization subunit type 1 TsaB [Alphaproteobacteria bacterium]|nr:tRNA (adenosine(37)-N6)-threonylcarbamoyltransferase complex dimerization subunit type 1 TsaB [Alphaproteobacteria bacterium]USO07475.1 MAG: tRNA (adenosine(37)-N6)-threonylcarbamoyltransferase complex dimerization subunit type 1 TsaB [Rhodospirillales bacterium]
MSGDLNILAVDTALSACGVAVRRADGTLFAETEPMERGQAERLMPMIMERLDAAGLTLRDIDAYAVANGPGTFTGLRVGLATIRALAQISGKPAYGIGSFDAIARALPDRPLCILIETKRSDYYVRAPGCDDACMSGEELKAIIRPDWTLAGDAVARARAELGLSNPAHELAFLPLDALVAGALSFTLSRARDHAGASPALPEPVYLRGADVSSARRKPARIV